MEALEFGGSLDERRIDVARVRKPHACVKHVAPDQEPEPRPLLSAGSSLQREKVWNASVSKSCVQIGRRETIERYVLVQLHLRGTRLGA